jgi:pyridoxine 5'-phosphate synthase PdxJ
MQFILILNKVLDIKVVQYLLLGFTLLLILNTIALTMKYKALELIAEQRKNAISELQYNLEIQNSKILEANDQLKQQEFNLSLAKEKALKISSEANKAIEKALSVEFTGECDSDVAQVRDTIRSLK